MLGIHSYLSRQVSPYSCISISFEHLHLYFSDPIYVERDDQDMSI